MSLVHFLVHPLVHPKPQKYKCLRLLGPLMVHLVHETGQGMVRLVHPFRVDQWTSPEICRFLSVGLVHPDQGSLRALLRYLKSSSTFYLPEMKFDAHNNEWALAR